MAAPCALFASCTAFQPEELVKQILNVSELPDGRPVVESVLSYDWHIDTKYYTADVQLCTTTTRTIGDQSFAQSVQAFVVYFDSKEVSSFDAVKSWMSYLQHINPAVQILVCQTSRQDDAVSRLTAQQWCIEHGFELVELEPEAVSDDEDEEFVESNGVKRIIQALLAHTWPNLELKNRSPVCSPYFRGLMQEEAALRASAAAAMGEDERSDASRGAVQLGYAPAALEKQLLQTAVQGHSVGGEAADASGSEQNQGSENQHNGLLPCSVEGGSRDSAEGLPARDITAEFSLIPDDNELALLAALGNEDPGEESFEQIFTRLRLMKEKAATLPPEQRKIYAEKIAVTFWRAVGGDEDEIEGLFDDGDGEAST